MDAKDVQKLDTQTLIKLTRAAVEEIALRASEALQMRLIAEEEEK